MNLTDSYKLIKSSIQSISNIELVPTSAETSDSYQCQVNIDYQERTRHDILAALPKTSAPLAVPDCCPICLIQFKPTSKLQHGRRCQHMFHSKCLVQWLSDETRECLCPICRRLL